MATKSKKRSDYGQGFCDGWFQCLIELIDDDGEFSNQAHLVYWELWSHYIFELEPWRRKEYELPPKFMSLLEPMEDE